MARTSEWLFLPRLTRFIFLYIAIVQQLALQITNLKAQIIPAVQAYRSD